ncbi:MAG: Unknown protein [uncultured Sulfurovum sp.]|uniref:Uncharacterized protein n=1 Tax=uncultured Sulfurovum sp. TaxID=269237 RepID=A0A6S6SMI1_9BACT|nr:MAG: Unknown protein [uncultured Sulfurovum sp.]
MQNLTLVKSPTYQGFSDEESKLIMSKSTGLMKCWSYLAFNTGMSASELIAVKVSDVDFRNDTLTTQEGIVYNLSKKTKYLIAEHAESQDIDEECPVLLFFGATLESINKYSLQPLLDILNIKGSLDSFEQTFARFNHPQYGQQLIMPAESNVSVTSKEYVPLSEREV